MHKSKLIERIERDLSAVLDPEDYRKVISIITVDLGAYSVEETGTEVAPPGLINEQYLEEWAATLLVANRSKKSIVGYVKELRRFDTFICKDYDKVTPFDIKRYLAAASMRGCKSTTVCNMWSYLSAFYTFLVGAGYITVSPISKVPKPKQDKVIKSALSAEDIARLRDAVTDPRCRALIEFLLASGVRVNELINIRREDVSLQDMSVHVKVAKGSKERITYISPVAAMYLREYLATRKDSKPWLFLEQNGSQMSIWYVEHYIKKLGDSLGIRLHPHRFRHTLATQLSEKGVPVQYIQLILGHSSLSTTMVYCHSSMESVKAAYMQKAI